MTRLLMTSLMTLTFVFGGLAIDASPAQACDSCAAHKKAKGKKKACAKCKKAGKASCECGKKKSDDQASAVALDCGKCGKKKKGCDCGKDCGKDCDCAKCKKKGKKSCGCDHK